MNDKLPPIKGFIETSFIDWPGKISAVLFLPGCNLACPYCHNYSLVNNPNSYYNLDLDVLLRRLNKIASWIDGIVISGGEPTLQPGLSKLLAIIKSAGFLIKLDTNGLRPKVLKKLLNSGLVDMVAMDIKASLNFSTYARATGKIVNLTDLVESINFLINNNISHEFRSTIWPAWHNQQELLRIGKSLQGAQAWILQALNPQTAWSPKILGEGQPYNKKEIIFLQKNLADSVCCISNHKN